MAALAVRLNDTEILNDAERKTVAGNDRGTVHAISRPSDT